jgi:hypothetical protein
MTPSLLQKEGYESPLVWLLNTGMRRRELAFPIHPIQPTKTQEFKQYFVDRSWWLCVLVAHRFRWLRRSFALIRHAV